MNKETRDNIMVAYQHCSPASFQRLEPSYIRWDMEQVRKEAQVKQYSRKPPKVETQAV